MWRNILRWTNFITKTIFIIISVKKTDLQRYIKVGLTGVCGLFMAESLAVLYVMSKLMFRHTDLNDSSLSKGKTFQTDNLLKFSSIIIVLSASNFATFYLHIYVIFHFHIPLQVAKIEDFCGKNCWLMQIWSLDHKRLQPSIQCLLKFSLPDLTEGLLVLSGRSALSILADTVIPNKKVLSLKPFAKTFLPVA